MRKNAQSYPPAAGFTLVEVMMAAVILTVGFIGLIESVTICSGMMDQARRQSLATQILTHEIEALRLASWSTVSTLPTTQTPVGAAWNGGLGYSAGDSVTYSGTWFRCVAANSGQIPTNTTYWKPDIPPYATTLSSNGVAFGATYTIIRTISDVDPGNIREATFTITWVVKTSRVDSSAQPVTFTSTRVNSVYLGKYGLNLVYQRS